MLYPEKFKDNEYIRMIALRRDKDGNVGQDDGDKEIRYIKSFKSFQWFINKYRETHDVYNQIATNYGRKDGTITSQWLRKVIYLDFDKKDYPDMKDARDCTQMIKDKIPKLFLHGCINSRHGYHYYVSINLTCKVKEVVEINKALVSILGADIKAASPTQISRPPCTYNHKLDDGTYDYENLNEYPCYLCVKKMLNEGADKGQRNFGHGRIVNMLKMEHYFDSQVYSLCQEYNLRCRQPKSKKIIEDDTKRFLEEEKYKLFPYRCH